MFVDPSPPVQLKPLNTWWTRWGRSTTVTPSKGKRSANPGRRIRIGGKRRSNKILEEFVIEFGEKEVHQDYLRPYRLARLLDQHRVQCVLVEVAHQPLPFHIQA